MKQLNTGSDPITSVTCTPQKNRNIQFKLFTGNVLLFTGRLTEPRSQLRADLFFRAEPCARKEESFIQFIHALLCLNWPRHISKTLSLPLSNFKSSQLVLTTLKSPSTSQFPCCNFLFQMELTS